MKCTNIHHVGLWADDVDEMVSFFTDVLGFRLLTRPEFNWGDRAFVDVGGDQAVEILTKPEMQPRPDMAAHMAEGIGAVVGVPHICFRVTDLPAWEEKFRSLGYAINNKAPGQGYGRFELGSVRAIWITGPSGVDFEFFEFQEEYCKRDLLAESVNTDGKA
jgi:catechol 2,3-dioxygenase-like lactoylglutathione lyase family enzyme